MYTYNEIKNAKFEYKYPNEDLSEVKIFNVFSEACSKKSLEETYEPRYDYAPYGRVTWEYGFEIDNDPKHEINNYALVDAIYIKYKGKEYLFDFNEDYSKITSVTKNYWDTTYHIYEDMENKENDPETLEAKKALLNFMKKNEVQEQLTELFRWKKELIFRKIRREEDEEKIINDFQNNKELFKNLVNNLYEKKYEMILYDDYWFGTMTLVRDTKYLYQDYAILIHNIIEKDEKNLDSLISILREEEFENPLSCKAIKYGLEKYMKLYPSLKIECNEKKWQIGDNRYIQNLKVYNPFSQNEKIKIHYEGPWPEYEEYHIYESGFTVEKDATENGYNLGNSIYFKVNEEEYIADFEDLEYKKILKIHKMGNEYYDFGSLDKERKILAEELQKIINNDLYSKEKTESIKEFKENFQRLVKTKKEYMTNIKDGELIHFDNYKNFSISKENPLVNIIDNAIQKNNYLIIDAEQDIPTVHKGLDYDRVIDEYISYRGKEAGYEEIALLASNKCFEHKASYTIINEQIERILINNKPRMDQFTQSLYNNTDNIGKLLIQSEVEKNSDHTIKNSNFKYQPQNIDNKIYNPFKKHIFINYLDYDHNGFVIKRIDVTDKVEKINENVLRVKKDTNYNIGNKTININPGDGIRVNSSCEGVFSKTLGDNYLLEEVKPFEFFREEFGHSFEYYESLYEYICSALPSQKNDVETKAMLANAFEKELDVSVEKFRQNDLSIFKDSLWNLNIEKEYFSQYIYDFISSLNKEQKQNVLYEMNEMIEEREFQVLKNLEKNKMSYEPIEYANLFSINKDCDFKNVSNDNIHKMFDKIVEDDRALDVFLNNINRTNARKFIARLSKEEKENIEDMLHRDDRTR